MKLDEQEVFDIGISCKEAHKESKTRIRWQFKKSVTADFITQTNSGRIFHVWISAYKWLFYRPDTYYGMPFYKLHEMTTDDYLDLYNDLRNDAE